MNRWLIAGVIVEAVMIVLAFAGAYGLAVRALHESQHALCPILALSLAERPPPHPTRADQLGRADLAKLARQYGC